MALATTVLSVITLATRTFVRCPVVHARTYSGSTYTEYLVYAYGEIYFSRKDYKSAIDLYERITDNPDFTRGETVLSHLTAAYLEVGDQEGANHSLLELKMRYPHSEYIHMLETKLSVLTTSPR